MPSSELETWREFYELEPFGLDVQDGLFAHLGALLANIHRDRKQQAEPFKVEDFLLFRAKPAELPSVMQTEDGLLADPDKQSNMLLGLFAGVKLVHAQ